MSDPTGRKTIMLVDDNPTSLSIGKDMLKEKYKVFPIVSAKKMFELLENVSPDLILLDVEMPEMDGFEALEILKSSSDWSSIPVIVVSGNTCEDCEEKGLAGGAVAFISKPFSADQIIDCINKHV